MTTPPNRRRLAVSGVLVWMLLWPSLSTATTATPSATETPTPAACPVATPEPFWVDPVTSPTDQFFQTITVHIGNGQRVEVITESGVYAIEDFSPSDTVRVDVRLYPSTTTHLEVVAYVRVIASPAGCTYGGYSLRTTVDRFGAPLTIEQQGVPSTPTPVVVDVSSFSEFHFERTSALGFCPPLDAVFSASIQARVGSYQLEMSVLQAGQSGVDACVPGCCAATECAVAVAQPPRDMTDAETARMRAVFSQQRMYFEPDPPCAFIAYDPCLINQARWDALTVDDYPCSAGRRVDAAQVETLTTFLEGLRPDRTPPPSLTPTATVAQPTLTATPTATCAQTQLSFELIADPPHPRVGEQVTVTAYIGRTGSAGLPRFRLSGTDPFLTGALEEVSPSGPLPGSVSYHGQAVAAGRATLQLHVTYEGLVCGVFSFLDATSQPFTLDISAETPLPTPTPLPACTDCATPGEPCTLSFGATGEITDRVTMQPIPSAAVLIDRGSPGPYVLPYGLYQIAATRTETCNADYAFSMRVVAPGYHAAVQNGFFPAQAFPLHVDVELDRVVGELPEIRVSPDSFSAGCMQTFQIKVESSGPVGSTLELAGFTLRQEHSQLYFGSGFAWNTTAVTLPASLASGQVMEIPVTFNAVGQEFRSRLELTVDSNAVNDPHVIRVYFGSSERTCAPSVTPTPTPTNMSGSMTPTPATTASPLACVGDCDGMHKVVITNIITLVNTALGNADISGCEAGDANGDRMVTIDEILVAVSYALSGCP